MAEVTVTKQFFSLKILSLLLLHSISSIAHHLLPVPRGAWASLLELASLGFSILYCVAQVSTVEYQRPCVVWRSARALCAAAARALRTHRPAPPYAAHHCLLLR